MNPILLTVLKAIGNTLLGLLVSLLTGKTFKVIVYWPLKWLTSKTKTTRDDKVIEKVADDWHIDDADWQVGERIDTENKK